MLNLLIVCVAPLGVELGCGGLQWVAVKDYAVVSLMKPGETLFI
jgi:hypothetical protein